MSAEIDFTNAEIPETYSDETRDKAEAFLAAGRVKHRVGDNRAYCESETEPGQLRVPTAVCSRDGLVLGISCTCPNGRNASLRARCWHAAALESLLREEGRAWR